MEALSVETLLSRTLSVEPSRGDNTPMTLYTTRTLPHATNFFFFFFFFFFFVQGFELIKFDRD
jgi:hypothetical protein